MVLLILRRCKKINAENAKAKLSLVFNLELAFMPALNSVSEPGNRGLITSYESPVTNHSVSMELKHPEKDT